MAPGMEGAPAQGVRSHLTSSVLSAAWQRGAHVRRSKLA